MVLTNIALLLADTARSKAYLQMMEKKGLIPEKIIVYVENKKEFMSIKESSYVDNRAQEDKFFDVNEPLYVTLSRLSVKYDLIECKDINSDIMISNLKTIPQKYIIYSGYGGAILKAPLFNIGKKFIHVHAGILPEYRGSTTAYYSILAEQKIGATAIFLSEGIDAGAIIHQKEFTLPMPGINIDYVYEPYVRAVVLGEVLMVYSKGKVINERTQDSKNANTYFVIHPVLKHLALLSLENSNG